MWSFLSSLPKWAGKVIDLIKGLFTALYIRRSTRIETEKNVLEEANAIQRHQIDIAARPPADPDDLRKRMRRGDL